MAKSVLSGLVTAEIMAGQASAVSLNLTIDARLRIFTTRDTTIGRAPNQFR